MKSNEIKKQSITIEAIYSQIEQVSKDNPQHFKHFIPHFLYVSESVKDQLMRDGFNLTIGDWDGYIRDCLIISW